ncbi:parallel beta-helix repeat-containing protein [Candidatus Protofrankia californiensis]|uniref:Parallel beta-helix repeat-containing protein n=1 Tax=Candidatus Protofrankia californiensis TaxID=1839754 RepID=A0A1C3NUP8_9ACTN|nr:parallel beta-helix repeat-containing protein [Candidatus Protofrankia californiensis]
MIIPTLGFAVGRRPSSGTGRRRRLRARVLVGGVFAGMLVGVVPGLVGAVGAALAAPPQPLPPVTSADAKKQALLVDAEDIRLRSMFEKFGVLRAPAMVQTQGSLPTLLLPARPAPYTAEEVAAAGGMRREVDGATLVLTNIVVGPDARLVLDQRVGTLRLASSPTGFVGLTSWRGAIEINGNAQQPLNILGWDIKELRPDVNSVDGRAYIRTMGGELVVRNARASNLGFWSGRTSGVAWTGSKGEPSTGGAANSTFINNIWGAYISGSEGIQMINVKLENNDRAGLAIKRDAVSTLISGSTSTGNHGDGITIDRASGSRVMRSTISDNSGDGITLDGRGIGIVATATGVQINQIKGTVIEANTLTGNGRYGIRVLGGEDTVVRGNKVSKSQVGVVVKSGANGTQILDNTVGGVVDSAVQIGPDAKRTAITTNTLADGRMGIIAQDAATNIISRNKISGSTEFAVTVRGQADGTTVGSNMLAGRGWRAVDIRKATGITAAAVGNNDTSKWIPRLERPWYSIFERHPALFVWSFMVLLPILGWRTRRRWRKRAAEHPYPESELLVRRMTNVAASPAGPMDLVEATEVIAMPPRSGDLGRTPLVPGQAMHRTTTYRGAAAQEHRPAAQPRYSDQSWPAAASAAPPAPSGRQTSQDGPDGLFKGRDRNGARISQDDNPTMDGLRYLRDHAGRYPNDPFGQFADGNDGDFRRDGLPDASSFQEDSRSWNGHSPEDHPYRNEPDDDTTTTGGDEDVSVVKLDAVGPRAMISYNGRGRDRYSRRDPS